MRLLLDESIPRRLATHLGGVDVDTVYDRAWSGLKNGELLRAAEGEYDAFVTVDQNLQYQQRLSGFDIGVLVLAAHTKTASAVGRLRRPLPFGNSLSRVRKPRER